MWFPLGFLDLFDEDIVWFSLRFLDLFDEDTVWFPLKCPRKNDVRFVVPLICVSCREFMFYLCYLYLFTYSDVTWCPTGCPCQMMSVSFIVRLTSINFQTKILKNPVSKSTFFFWMYMYIIIWYIRILTINFKIVGPLLKTLSIKSPY